MRLYAKAAGACPDDKCPVGL